MSGAMHRLSVVVLLCALMGCSKTPPEICRDLPPDSLQGKQLLQARLEERFPEGTEEAALWAELDRQGFMMMGTIEEPVAFFSSGGFPPEWGCNVGWKADRGRVTGIWGAYGGNGP